MSWLLMIPLVISLLALSASIFIGVTLFAWKREWQARVESHKEELLRALEEELRQQWQDEMAAFKRESHAHLRALEKICLDATKLLSRQNEALESFPPSMEEQELKALAAAPAPEEAIPTLQELEKTKFRLHKEISFNLKALLQEQLA